MIERNTKETETEAEKGEVKKRAGLRVTGYVTRGLLTFDRA